MTAYTETQFKSKPFRRAIASDIAWLDRGDGFETAIRFEPGYDSHSREYGIGVMQIRFLLRGPLGAIQFLMAAGWVPGRKDVRDYYPSAWDIGYHSPKPKYGDQEPYDCEVLPGGTCYYDGSSLAAGPVLEAFIAEGEPAVWRALHELYSDRLPGDPS